MANENNSNSDGGAKGAPSYPDDRDGGALQDANKGEHECHCNCNAECLHGCGGLGSVGSLVKWRRLIGPSPSSHRRSGQRGASFRFGAFGAPQVGGGWCVSVSLPSDPAAWLSLLPLVRLWSVCTAHCCIYTQPSTRCCLIVA